MHRSRCGQRHPMETRSRSRSRTNSPPPAGATHKRRADTRSPSRRSSPFPSVGGPTRSMRGVSRSRSGTNSPPPAGATHKRRRSVSRSRSSAFTVSASTFFRSYTTQSTNKHCSSDSNDEECSIVFDTASAGRDQREKFFVPPLRSALATMSSRRPTYAGYRNPKKPESDSDEEEMAKVIRGGDQMESGQQTASESPTPSITPATPEVYTGQDSPDSQPSASSTRPVSSLGTAPAFTATPAPPTATRQELQPAAIPFQFRPPPPLAPANKEMAGMDDGSLSNCETPSSTPSTHQSDPPLLALPMMPSMPLFNVPQTAFASSQLTQHIGEALTEMITERGPVLFLLKKLVRDCVTEALNGPGTALIRAVVREEMFAMAAATANQPSTSSIGGIEQYLRDDNMGFNSHQDLSGDDVVALLNSLDEGQGNGDGNAPTGIGSGSQ